MESSAGFYSGEMVDTADSRSCLLKRSNGSAECGAVKVVHCDVRVKSGAVAVWLGGVLVMQCRVKAT